MEISDSEETVFVCCAVGKQLVKKRQKAEITRLREIESTLGKSNRMPKFGLFIRHFPG